MSLFNFANPEKMKKKFEELKKTLQFNPNYFEDMKAFKIKRELKAYL